MSVTPALNQAVKKFERQVSIGSYPEWHNRLVWLNSNSNGIFIVLNLHLKRYCRRNSRLMMGKINQNLQSVFNY